ncbi:unnamed protein product [Lepeophtheirus salmonis]|uniref:(salmon louse) hypothetical protein n=1 Tax=Lepeophtheirus salmonis TaxID=72036 RepID=A0A7R8H2S2_LEPSM|nr:unnamed protein product [Lepeophtheirus salmonis]CAF2831217.1 unnamed protein product [Lepeophtheirus salmonis]
MLLVNSSFVVQSMNNCNTSIISITDTCRTSQDSMNKVLYIIFCGTFIPLVVLSVLSNGFAFVIFYKKPIFRKIISNRLIMNLMGINLISCLLLFPAILVDMYPSSLKLIQEHENFRIALCTWGSFLSSFIAHGSIFAMLTIGLDQYVAILDPLEYPNKFTSLISSQLIICVWCTSFIASLSSSFILVSSHNTWKACDTVLVGLISSNQRLGLTLASVTLYLVPISCLVYLYAKVFFEARNNSIRRRRRSSSVINVTENPMEVQDETDFQIKETMSNNLLSPASPESEYSLRVKCQHPKLVNLRKDDSFSSSITSSSPSTIPMSNSTPRRNGGIIKQHSAGSTSLARKCSFSSVNECHLVEGTKVRTIIFFTEQSNSVSEEPAQNTIQSSPPTCIKTSIYDNDGTENKADDEGSFKSNTSILSKTSQAARRLSCSFSRGANNVYHFLLHNEERRTAKISSFVLKDSGLIMSSHMAESL